MNSYVSQAPVLGRNFMSSLVAALAARPAAALVVAAKLRLTTDPAFAPTPDSAIADFTAAEATFSGYTAGGYAWMPSATVNLDPDTLGSIGVIAAAAAVAGPFVPSTVTGYWIDDGTDVIMAEKFANGETAAFARPGDFLELDARFAVSMRPAVPSAV